MNSGRARLASRVAWRRGSLNLGREIYSIYYINYSNSGPARRSRWRRPAACAARPALRDRSELPCSPWHFIY